MKKVLHKLWHSYLIEEELPRGEAREQLTKNVSDTDNALRETLNEKQKSLLEEYDRAVCLLGCATERYAFIKGVRFTVKFLLEALDED